MRTFSALTGSGTCACGMNISGPGSSLSDPSRVSAMTPMICRSGSPANSRITPRPMMRRSVSGSPFGQNCFAIASLMIADRRRVLRVALGERPAALHGDPEHLEVARRHGLPPAAAVERPVGQRPADDDERQAVAALERHAARRAGDLDARNRAHPLDAEPHRLLDAVRLHEPLPRHRHPHRQDVPGSKPGFDRAQRDRGPHEQRRADEQDQRERDFGDHENRARLVLAEARARAAAALFQRGR